MFALSFFFLAAAYGKYNNFVGGMCWVDKMTILLCCSASASPTRSKTFQGKQVNEKICEEGEGERKKNKTRNTYKNFKRWKTFHHEKTLCRYFYSLIVLLQRDNVGSPMSFFLSIFFFIFVYLSSCTSFSNNFQTKWHTENVSSIINNGTISTELFLTRQKQTTNDFMVAEQYFFTFFSLLLSESMQTNKAKNEIKYGKKCVRMRN